jgi:hypothetical protein
MAPNAIYRTLLVITDNSTHEVFLFIQCKSLSLRGKTFLAQFIHITKMPVRRSSYATAAACGNGMSIAIAVRDHLEELLRTGVSKVNAMKTPNPWAFSWFAIVPIS